jgi:hypothetical protein
MKTDSAQQQRWQQLLNIHSHLDLKSEKKNGEKKTGKKNLFCPFFLFFTFGPIPPLWPNVLISSEAQCPGQGPSALQLRSRSAACRILLMGLILPAATCRLLLQLLSVSRLMLARYHILDKNNAPIIIKEIIITTKCTGTPHDFWPVQWDMQIRNRTALHIFLVTYFAVLHFCTRLPPCRSWSRCNGFHDTFRYWSRTHGSSSGILQLARPDPYFCSNTIESCIC